MSFNYLRLNPKKTELLWSGSWTASADYIQLSNSVQTPLRPGDMYESSELLRRPISSHEKRVSCINTLSKVN